MSIEIVCACVECCDACDSEAKLCLPYFNTPQSVAAVEWRLVRDDEDIGNTQNNIIHFT